MGRSKYQARNGYHPARWLSGLLAAALLFGLMTNAASAQGAVRSVHALKRVFLVDRFHGAAPRAVEFLQHLFRRGPA